MAGMDLGQTPHGKKIGIHRHIQKNTMKLLSPNAIIVLLARIFLGGIFVAAGFDKIADPQAFANSILQYKIVGSSLAMGAATFIPSLELLCGCSLIIGLYPRGCELLITLMLAGFTVFVASALLRGLDISCGCFTQDPAAGKIGYSKILENCGLILLSVWLLFIRDQGVSLRQFFRTQQDKSH